MRKKGECTKKTGFSPAPRASCRVPALLRGLLARSHPRPNLWGLGVKEARRGNEMGFFNAFGCCEGGGRWWGEAGRAGQIGMPYAVCFFVRVCVLCHPR